MHFGTACEASVGICPACSAMACIQWPARQLHPMSNMSSLFILDVCDKSQALVELPDHLYLLDQQLTPYLWWRGGALHMNSFQ